MVVVVLMILIIIQYYQVRPYCYCYCYCYYYYCCCYLVLKSDYSNGVFGFAPVDIAPVSEENITVPILVSRERGVYSSVTVSWEVTLDGILADNDFVYSTGNITIEANETQKVYMCVCIGH